MLKTWLKSKIRWLPLAFWSVLSCAGAAELPQEPPAAAGRTEWPKEFEAQDSRIVVYEPELESFRGNRLTTRAALSRTPEGAAEAVFGAVWLEATVATDADRRIVTPEFVKVTDVRFPNLAAAEAARLRQEIGDQIPRWNLSYSVDALLADLKLIEEQKTEAQALKADVPRIYFRSSPAVLLAIDDEPAWRPSADPSLQRLENSAAFVVREPRSGTCYLHVSPYWWTSTDPLGSWQPTDSVPGAVVALWNQEPKPQTPVADPDPAATRRPDVIPVTGPAELVCTDGAAQYAPITGTDLLYVKNTDSDVFLDTRTQDTYALFSGRWYRTPRSKDAWAFVPSDQLPADFAHIPIASEKRHVLACVAGTAEAREAVRNAEVPQTEAVKPGPAPDLQPVYDGEPQWTPIPEIGLDYAVNTPYSIFRIPGRYYWCMDGIWYDSAFAVGPWFVSVSVPRSIYLIPPSCPHYYVTYCRVFGATPDAVYVGYYPGYRGCYAWRGSVVYGTGWHYRPWIGTRCYPRPVTWGLGVRYHPHSSAWSLGVGGGRSSVAGLRRPSGPRAPVVQAGAGGYWGGAPSRPAGVRSYRNPSAAPSTWRPGQNLYTRQPERLAPNSPVRRPSTQAPTPAPGRGLRNPPPAPPARRESPPAPVPPREHREIPRTPPPAERDVPRTPPNREQPRTPPAPPRQRDVPRTPPPPEDIPRNPPPQQRDVPKSPPPPPPREAPRRPPPPPPREAPKSPPPPREQREIPRKAPPPQHREQQKAPPRSDDRRR